MYKGEVGWKEVVVTLTTKMNQPFLMGELPVAQLKRSDVKLILAAKGTRNTNALHWWQLWATDCGSGVGCGTTGTGAITGTEGGAAEELEALCCSRYTYCVHVHVQCTSAT